MPLPPIASKRLIRMTCAAETIRYNTLVCVNYVSDIGQMTFVAQSGVSQEIFWSPSAVADPVGRNKKKCVRDIRVSRT